MSAYCYSDSDSDYDSTASGSSQETVVEALSALSSKRSKVKPPVPPKSTKLKSYLAKQGPGQKPPVPPKPEHLKAVFAGKITRDFTYKESASTRIPQSFCPVGVESQEIKQRLQQGNQGSEIVVNQGAACLNGNVFATNVLSDVRWAKANHSIVTLYDDTAQGGNCPMNHTPQMQELGQELRETIGAKYNVTMRNKSSRQRPRLEHRHSTGSMFSLANLPDLDDSSAGILLDDHKSCSRREYPSNLDYALSSLTLGRKKRSHQRVYFMLNV